MLKYIWAQFHTYSDLTFFTWLQDTGTISPLLLIIVLGTCPSPSDLIITVGLGIVVVVGPDDGVVEYLSVKLGMPVWLTEEIIATSEIITNCSYKMTMK